MTVGHAEEEVAKGVIVHRTRRIPESVLVNGIPTTTIERTLADLARYLPPRQLEKAVESAIRKGLTTATAINAFLADKARGKGLRGAKRLRGVMAVRPAGGPAGSDAEVELVQFLRDAGVTGMVRQHSVELDDSGWTASLDIAIPDRKLGISWDGWDFHSGRQEREYDLERKHALEDLKWRIREYTGAMLKRDPEGVARSFLRWLGGESQP